MPHSLLVPEVHEGIFWSSKTYPSYSKPPWLSSLHSPIYSIPTSKTVFSNTLHVYHLLLKSKLINSIKTPCLYPLRVPLNSSQHLAAGEPACLLSLLYTSCLFLPSQPFTLEHLPFVPSWVSSSELVSSSKLQPSLTSRPFIWKSGQFKHHNYVHLPLALSFSQILSIYYSKHL